MLVNKEMCHKLVGTLIYLFHMRPDTTCAVNVASQFMHNLKEMLQAAYRILQYLKWSSGKWIMFKKNDKLLLQACIGVDYARLVVDKIYYKLLYIP